MCDGGRRACACGSDRSFDKAALIEAVYGVKAKDLYKREPVELGDEALRAEHLCGPGFEGRLDAGGAGQITALMGAAGCGKEELARALAGLYEYTGARVAWRQGARWRRVRRSRP